MDIAYLQAEDEGGRENEIALNFAIHVFCFCVFFSTKEHIDKPQEQSLKSHANKLAMGGD
jgi:hypothetical protein